VRAYVAEPDLGLVALQKSKSVHRFSDQPYDGVIGFVSPTSRIHTKKCGNYRFAHALVYRLRVVVDQPDSKLRQGMLLLSTCKIMSDDAKGNAIVITNLQHQFNGKPALRDINTTIQRGIITGIVGPDGAGKTNVNPPLSRFAQSD